MYVTLVPNRSSPPAVLLRESYRENGKVTATREVDGKTTTTTRHDLLSKPNFQRTEGGRD